MNEPLDAGDDRSANAAFARPGLRTGAFVKALAHLPEVAGCVRRLAREGSSAGRGQAVGASWPKSVCRVVPLARGNAIAWRKLAQVVPAQGTLTSRCAAVAARSRK